MTSPSDPQPPADAPSPEAHSSVRVKELEAALTEANAKRNGLTAERDAVSECLYDAYLGIKVLLTICKRHGLKGGQEASEQLLDRINAVAPEFAGRSAMR